MPHPPNQKTIDDLRNGYLCLGSARQTLDPSDPFYAEIRFAQAQIESLIDDARCLRDGQYENARMPSTAQSERQYRPFGRTERVTLLRTYLSTARDILRGKTMSTADQEKLANSIQRQLDTDTCRAAVTAQEEVGS